MSRVCLHQVSALHNQLDALRTQSEGGPDAVRLVEEAEQRAGALEDEALALGGELDQCRAELAEARTRCEHLTTRLR